MLEYTPMESGAKELNNSYVKDYYDTQVGALTSYTDDRWNSSPVRKFEYKQTERALRQALVGRTYGTAVEIGPGDGVWTRLIREYVPGKLHLVEQSKEMLVRAKEALASLPDITFEEGDFLTSNPPTGNDLVIAIRCFEYFDDKIGSLKKMKGLLKEGGRLVIVTKNPELVTSVPVQNQTLHSDQVSRKEMRHMAAEAGLHMEGIFPAVLRVKATFAPMRFLSDFVQRVAVASRGMLSLPIVGNYATESYVYILRG